MVTTTARPEVQRALGRAETGGGGAGRLRPSAVQCKLSAKKEETPCSGAAERRRATRRQCFRRAKKRARAEQGHRPRAVQTRWLRLVGALTMVETSSGRQPRSSRALNSADAVREHLGSIWPTHIIDLKIDLVEGARMCDDCANTRSPLPSRSQTDGPCAWLRRRHTLQPKHEIADAFL